MLDRRLFRLSLAIALVCLALNAMPSADAHLTANNNQIVFVDPDEVLVAMKLRTQLEGELGKLAEEYRATLDALTATRTQRVAELKIWPEHSPKWWETQREIQALSAQIEFDKKFFDEALQQKRMQNTFDLYNKIIDAVTVFAKSQKPSPIVLRCSKKNRVGGDDATNLTVEQFTMSFRTVLYYPPSFDRTAEIIAIVNQ
jgi:Skp family chaperone for outer membrane proteins